MPNHVAHDLLIYDGDEKQIEEFHQYWLKMIENNNISKTINREYSTQKMKRRIENNQRKKDGLDQLLEIPKPETPITINEDLIPHLQNWGKITDDKEIPRNLFGKGEGSIKISGLGACNWNRENWGSKWGLYNLECEYENELYHFETAWSPSVPLYDALAKKFPKIPFRICYFEQGMQFSGEIRYENGTQISNEEVKYFGRRGG